MTFFGLVARDNLVSCTDISFSVCELVGWVCSSLSRASCSCSLVISAGLVLSASVGFSRSIMVSSSEGSSSTEKYSSTGESFLSLYCPKLTLGFGNSRFAKFRLAPGGRKRLSFLGDTWPVACCTSSEMESCILSSGLTPGLLVIGVDWVWPDGGGDGLGSVALRFPSKDARSSTSSVVAG